jgi:hypothetical protein
MEERLNFAVERWCAWEPQAGAQALCTHYNLGAQVSETIEKPDLAAVPSMQRRRLGTLARTVFHVLTRCADVGAQEPVVFCSYMGEIDRIQEILGTIAAHQPVSPALFSLSVHNAIGGQWSLIHGIKAPMVALASPANSPVPALLEAKGILLEGEYPAINVVYYEEPYPQFYAPFLRGPVETTALALRLVSVSDAHTQGVVCFDVQLLPALGAAPDLRANHTALAELLTGRSRVTRVLEDQCSWQLELCQ